MSLFIVTYRRKLRIGANIRRKEKVEKAIEFVERMKNIQKEIGEVLKRAQEEVKRKVDKRQRKAEI